MNRLRVSTPVPSPIVPFAFHQRIMKPCSTLNVRTFNGRRQLLQDGKLLAAVGARLVFVLAFMGLLLAIAQAAWAADAPNWPGLSSGLTERILLNGEWQHTVSRQLDYPTDAADWNSITVPLSPLKQGRAAGGSDYAWFRRVLSVPAEWTENRIFLRLVGARYHPRVFVNGELVAEQLDGWTPFETELTKHLRSGESLELVVCCQDWGATFADGYILPEDATGDLRSEAILQGKVIAPIGGHWSHYGIWDDIELIARPANYLDDVAIQTLVRQDNRIVVSGTIQESPGWVDGTVMDNGETVLTIPAAAADPERRWEIAASFADAQYWSPENPHLYQLRLTLRQEADGDVIAVHEEDFGFRELWAEGPDFYFNGIKRHLLATSGWPTPYYQNDDEIRESLLKMKAANCVAFRLHTQPWQERWLDIADEVGIMIIEEGSLWCDGAGLYAYKDNRYWDNVETHLLGMVRRDRNHASLVMWSLENEILHCGAGRYCPKAEKRLSELGLVVKALDPSHLITYESDLDPGGVADVIGLHYPHELPDYTDYPNTADWIEQTVTTGTEGGLMGSRGENFHWERDKPLYIGEYLWVPWENYAPGTVFFGDKAYEDERQYFLKAKALAWEHQTLAYRRAGVSGLCPWTFVGSGGQIDTESPLYQSQKKVYEPVAVFPRDLDSRFFSGEQVTRRFDVFNDSVEPRTLQIQGWLGGELTALSEIFGLAPGGYREVTLLIDLPTVSERQALPFSVVLLWDGQQIHRSTAQYTLFPKKPITAPNARELLILDPQGSLAELAGKRLETWESLTQANSRRTLLVVGPNAFAQDDAEQGDVPVIGQEVPGVPEVRAFIASGGRVLILEQENPEALAALGVTLVDHPSTMTFPTEAEHPLLDGIQHDDWQFWRGDHYVSRLEIQRPESHGARTYVVSGGIQTLSQGPVAEIRSGQGTLLLCQALVGNKLNAEPVARRFLQNALRYLADGITPSVQHTYLFAPNTEGETARFAGNLHALGVAFDTLTPADLEPVDPYDTLFLMHGGGRSLNAAMLALQQLFVEYGTPRSIYWHAPEPSSFALVAPVLTQEFAVLMSLGPIHVRRPSTSILTGVYRGDLLYVGKPGERYHRFDPDPNVIDRVLMPVADVSAPGRRFEVEEMRLTGSLVRVSGDMVYFATHGTAETSVEIGEAGLYRATLIASGSAAAGVYPRVVFQVNGSIAGEIMLSQIDRHAYSLMLDLPEGEVSIELAFANDAVVDGEDRNLQMDALLLDANPINEDRTQILTTPAAVAVLGIQATESKIVVDGVRWDKAETNHSRGRRYASALLANLGANFRPLEPKPSWILPVHIEPVGTIPYFRKAEREISLAASGTVQADFHCTVAGKYEVFVRGRSTPAEGVYAKTEVKVDGEMIGETEIATTTSGLFLVGVLTLTKGKHHVEVRFSNDLQRGGEDRNLYLHAIGFRRAER